MGRDLLLEALVLDAEDGAAPSPRFVAPAIFLGNLSAGRNGM
jgi:hypothetical protein